MKIFLYLVFFRLALAATVTYNWAITWVWANPDGFGRPVIGINGHWPLPTIEANLGDTIVVNVVNQLGNQTTGIHFHGQAQKGTNTMDGPSGVNQCSIPPGGTFKYQFTAGPAGSYWYHSHNKGQYPDGFRGPLIVHDPNDPYLSSYSVDLNITLSDWFWTQMPDLLLKYLSPENSDGVEPAPNTTLINDALSTKLKVKPNTTYRLRIINVSNMASMQFKIQSHAMTVIAVDGVNVEKFVVPQDQSLYIATAQRVDILFTTKPTANQNYFFVSSLDMTMYGDPSTVTRNTSFGYLQYNPALPLPQTFIPTFNPIDDTALVPYDKQPILRPVTRNIKLQVQFIDDQYDINRAVITSADQTYVPPLVPTLYTALSAPPADVMNPLIYGNGTNPFVVSNGDIVEVQLDNLDTGSHPFHMHGHQFQVVYRGSENSPLYDGTQPLIQTPVRRDVIFVNTNSSVVWRFKADNPGVFLLHCHIEFHVEAGLTATIIESPNLLQGTLTIPPDHLKVCHQDGQKTVGNAAGNSQNFLNLTGQPLVPPRYDCGSLIGACPPQHHYRGRAWSD